MIFEWLTNAASAQAAADAQRRAMDAELQLRRYNAFCNLHNPNWRGAADPPGIINVEPTCNCRNCGAPFEPSETQCSYCRSER
jgi:hypothetical protein